ncbi:MAG: type II toxin-antitoxin system HicB family antitoxin [Candidatus Aminicenantes bacterium]|nr:type II toxin-antitoxin system HicB family antitoxin [Candidatus Aminicenantes bacterium]
MKNTLLYKKFLGSVHYSPEDECFHGRVEGIDDLVTFEGRSVVELKRSFKEAVGDYIALCRKTGKDLSKSYAGSFNVRIPSDLHKRAVRKSASEGISLNRLVRRAIEKEVGT